MLINPFTGQVLNVNPQGYNQYTGKGPESNRKRLQQIAGDDVRIEYKIPEAYEKSVRLSGDYFPPEVDWDTEEVTKPATIFVSPGRYEGAIAAHEIGHHKLGHTQDVEYEDDAESRERDAWRYALKNRKSMAVSKRKLFRLMRTAEVLAKKSRGTFGPAK